MLLSDGRYQLCTSNAVYSYEDKYINFRTAFEWIRWETLKTDKVLLLGLGLGSVPQMLEKLFKRNFEYHAVEIDEKIIELANRYVLKKLDSPIQVFHTDGLHYVRLCQEKYDMIIMDIFENDKVPVAFETPEFLAKLADLLLPGGFILYNRLNIKEKDHEETLRYFEDVFIKQFPEASCSPIAGNYMLCSSKEVFALHNS